MVSGQLFFNFGTSRETSDFLADTLESWWETRKSTHPQVRKLVIELDNGPELQSHRTQFMKRLVEFADRSELELELVYFPPYHSKYNPIERCWGILEMHWNGTLLDGIETTLGWARTMTWKGLPPIVKLFERTYERGVKLTRQAFASIAARLERSATLPRWSLKILPQVAPSEATG